MAEAVAAVALGGCLCITVLLVALTSGSGIDIDNELLSYAGTGLAGELLAMLALVRLWLDC